MAKRILLAFSLLSLLLVAGALIGSTQYVARELRHDRRLGLPATKIAGVPIYEPWPASNGISVFTATPPGVFGAANLITYGTLVVSLVPLLVAAFVNGRGRGGSTSHGSARWGTTEELRKGGNVCVHIPYST